MPPDASASPNSAWRCGWVVVSDVNHNNQVDVNDALLRHVTGIKGVVITNNVRDALLRVAPSGVVSPMQSLQFCIDDNAQWMHYARKLVVAISGRIRSDRLQDGKGCTAS